MTCWRRHASLKVCRETCWRANRLGSAVCDTGCVVEMDRLMSEKLGIISDEIAKVKASMLSEESCDGTTPTDCGLDPPAMAVSACNADADSGTISTEETSTNRGE